MLLLPKTDLEEVRLLAESIEEAFMRETMQSFPLSISLGWQTKTEAGGNRLRMCLKRRRIICTGPNCCRAPVSAVK